MSAALLAGACSSSVAETPYVSVRDRLTGEPTALAVAPDSAGHLTVRRRVLDGWQTIAVDLAITDGMIELSSDDAGTVGVEHLELGIGPLDLPLGDEPTQIVDIRAELERRVDAASTWTDDNLVGVATTADLRGHWSLSVDGRVSPLADLHLAGMEVTGAVTGDAARVDATISLGLPGTVWEWAGLVELADLTLTIDASATAL